MITRLPLIPTSRPAHSIYQPCLCQKLVSGASLVCKTMNPSRRIPMLWMMFCQTQKSPARWPWSHLNQVTFAPRSWNSAEWICQMLAFQQGSRDNRGSGTPILNKYSVKSCDLCSRDKNNLFIWDRTEGIIRILAFEIRNQLGKFMIIAITSNGFLCSYISQRTNG